MPPLTPAAFDLCTREYAMARLNSKPKDTVDDDMIQGLVTAVSAAFMKETSRYLLTRTYTDVRFNGRGGVRQFLPQAPITAIASLKVDEQAILPAATSVGPGFMFDADSVYLIGSGKFTARPQNILITYTAGYDPESEDPVHLAAVADLKDACARQVVHEYLRRATESDRTKTLGAGETVTFVVDAFLAPVQRTLDRFKRPVMA